VTYSTRVTRFVVGSSLPLAYQVEPKLYQSVTVARLPLTDLAPGDLVHVTAAGQAATRDGITRAMHARYLKATKTADNASTEGLLLARPMGVNFDNLDHYSLLTAAGSFVVDPVWAGTVTLMFVMYAANLAQQPDDPRSLEVKYVELRADVFRPDTT
jgi:hypothetical protein